MRLSFLLVAACCLAGPVAGQTVYLPSYKAQAEAIAREKASKTAGKEAALVNKMLAVNEVGTNGYDIVTFDNRVRAVRGTPFIVPFWTMGDVLLGTATVPRAGVFKFDVYTQQLRVLREQGDSIILDPARVQDFTLRPTGRDGQPVVRHFERLPSALAPEGPASYAEALSAGAELRLLKFERKTILKGHADSAYGNNTPVDSFQSSAQYYLRWADGTYVSVRPSKSSVLAAIAMRQTPLAAAELQDKAKARTDAELAAMVQRIDTQLEKK